jgi:hypothetical protein
MPDRRRRRRRNVGLLEKIEDVLLIGNTSVILPGLDGDTMISTKFNRLILKYLILVCI